MDDPNLPVICRSCGRTVRAETVKFDDVNKVYVCTNCYNASHSSSGAKPVLRKAEPTATSPKQYGKLSTDKVNYQCVKCGYAFSRAKDKQPSGCPYCGNKVLEIRDTAASRLIDESTGWE